MLTAKRHCFWGACLTLLLFCFRRLRAWTSMNGMYACAVYIKHCPITYLNMKLSVLWPKLSSELLSIANRFLLHFQKNKLCRLWFLFKGICIYVWIPMNMCMYINQHLINILVCVRVQRWRYRPVWQEMWRTERRAPGGDTLTRCMYVCIHLLEQLSYGM
jgi:hypothetical protein